MGLPLIIGIGVIAAAGYMIMRRQRPTWEKVRTQWKQVVSRGFAAHPSIACAGAFYIGKGTDETKAKILYKLYYQENGKWIEETTANEFPKDIIPLSILDRLKDGSVEADITDEMEKEINIDIPRKDEEKNGTDK